MCVFRSRPLIQDMFLLSKEYKLRKSSDMFKENSKKPLILRPFKIGECFPTKGKGWAQANSFQAKPGQVCLVPSPKGDLEEVWFGVSKIVSPWDIASIFLRIPEGEYSLDIPVINEVALLS